VVVFCLGMNHILLIIIHFQKNLVIKFIMAYLCKRIFWKIKKKT